MQCLNIHTHKEAHCIHITMMRFFYNTYQNNTNAYDSVIVITISRDNNAKYVHQPLPAIHKIPACV